MVSTHSHRDIADALAERTGTGPTSPPVASCQVFLARHGRTFLNAESRLRGLADPPLDDVGVDQAAHMGATLANKGILRVLSSPLQRARNTALTVASLLRLEATVDPRLNDRDYGPWTGHLKSDVIAEWGSVDSAPGVEPVESVLERVWPLFEWLKGDSITTVLVTHDAVISAVLARILTQEARLETSPGCWNELRFTTDE